MPIDLISSQGNRVFVVAKRNIKADEMICAKDGFGENDGSSDVEYRV
jgi:hypothetical protein